MPCGPSFASSISKTFAKPAHRPYQRPFSTTPPSSSAVGSATPFLAQTLHDIPFMEPEASCVDCLVKVAAGCPEDAAVTVGLQLDCMPPAGPPRPTGTA